jgi:carbamoyltransferase
VNILGISAFYHDSAACLVQDGRLVGAAQEERFSRKKHDYRFPQHAIDYCLEAGRITPAQLDHVAFYDKPLLKFERLLETYLSFAPVGFKSFLESMPLWMRQKIHLPKEMDRGLKDQFKGRYVFTEHHESHAASAFFPSPFEEAAILTLDGVGEWATASYGSGRGNRIDITHEMHFPHSLGLLYTAFTYYCGFKANSGEYKLMGLAPYGEPKYKDVLLSKVMDLKPDGSLRMDMKYFNYCQGLTMTSPAFHELFGAPPRSPESMLTQREMDIAASIQWVTEEVMLRASRHVHKETGGLKNLVLAGGVALNCVGNGRILREGPFENIWIQPAAGDAGGALGAALFVWYQLLNNPRKVDPQLDSQQGSLLGPGFDDVNRTRQILDKCGAKYHYIENEEELVNRVAELLSQEKVIGHCAGRMEFGPRALGCRSIIGDARSPAMQSVMNLKIKFRESFRPFAPCVLRENVHEFFDMRPNEDSPYMLLVAPVREEKRLPVNGEKAFGIDKLKQLRSVVPAITHVDYSARVQTVDPVRHPRMHKIMSRFKDKTGCPVIINTSFNVRSEPIVCSPSDAYRCFMACNMDVLVVENFIMYKEEQKQMSEAEIKEYLAQFQLD